MNTPDLALGVIWYIVFLFSTTCHEAAHALVAKIGGDLTAAEGGQVTLNPIPHIVRSPFGMVVVPILSFALGGWMIGWASAPFDPEWQRKYPRRSAWMALAGPAANFTLVLLSGIAIRVGVAAGYFRPPEFIAGYGGLVASARSADPTFLTTALSILFVLNLLLGTFQSSARAADGWQHSHHAGDAGKRRTPVPRLGAAVQRLRLDRLGDRLGAF